MKATTSSFHNHSKRDEFQKLLSEIRAASERDTTRTATWGAAGASAWSLYTSHSRGRPKRSPSFHACTRCSCRIPKPARGERLQSSARPSLASVSAQHLGPSRPHRRRCPSARIMTTSGRTLASLVVAGVYPNPCGHIMWSNLHCPVLLPYFGAETVTKDSHSLTMLLVVLRGDFETCTVGEVLLATSDGVGALVADGLFAVRQEDVAHKLDRPPLDNKTELLQVSCCPHVAAALTSLLPSRRCCRWRARTRPAQARARAYASSPRPPRSVTLSPTTCAPRSISRPTRRVRTCVAAGLDPRTSGLCQTRLVCSRY